MQKILGLDIGTNSIGWAIVENNSIKGIGSRIIPMGAEVLNFEKGNPQTKNADRRMAVCQRMKANITKVFFPPPKYFNILQLQLFKKKIIDNG